MNNRTTLNPPWACDRITDAAVPQVLRRPARCSGAADGGAAAGLPSAFQRHHEPRTFTCPPVSRSKLDARIALYDLVERPVRGDGNCQYRALAATLFGDEGAHGEVREAVCAVLAANRDLFEHHVADVAGQGAAGCGSDGWDGFLAASMSDGEWGDHLTLQAAADAFGVTIMLVTSFADDAAGVVSIAPMLGGPCQRDAPVMLSFYAERHYNALFPKSTASAPS